MFIRPMIDSQATNLPEPKEVGDAVTLASRLTNDAREAGVTEDVGQGERIAQLMSLYQSRDVHLRLLNDVDVLLTSADEQAGDAPGFKLQALYTDYLYGDVPLPTPGGERPRARGSGSGGRAQEAFVDEGYVPEMGGGGRFSTMNERGRMAAQPSYGEEMVEEATGLTGPRVAVTLDLSTTQPLVEVFVEQAVKRWLEQNAQREGLPYFYNIEDFQWDKLSEQRHEAAPEPGAGQVAGRETTGRVGEGRAGGRRSFNEREMMIEEGVATEGGGERTFTGARGGFQSGGGQLPQDAAQALSQLEQLAPIVPTDATEHPPGTIETFIRVTFVAVLGEPPAEGEEGDE
jgi:hypothetical protein